MKRLTWLAGFTIVAMAMPLAAFAGGSEDGKQKREKQEKRVEIRVERERGGERGGQRDDRGRGGDSGRRGGNEWRGDGEGMRWLFDNMHGEGHGGEWSGMREHAGRMFRGIHDRAINIHFQPQVEDSQVAIGFGNRNVQAEVINLNINIGDVIIDGNELSDGDAGEMLEMIMEMMMEGHGMHGGPGHNGPGPWHDRFDGNRPPVPRPPHEMHDDDHTGNQFFGEMMRSHGEHGIHAEHIEHNAEYDQLYRDVMREYNVIIESDSAPVEPGDVRSPYYEFYFGDGEMPGEAFVIIDELEFHGEHGMPPQSAQLFFHGDHGEDFAIAQLPAGPHGEHVMGLYDVRPEIMEMAMQIPHEVPLEFVELIFRLGEMAWEDEVLRERAQMLMAAEYETGDIEYQRMLRAFLQMLMDEAGGQG